MWKSDCGCGYNRGWLGQLESANVVADSKPEKTIDITCSLMDVFAFENIRTIKGYYLVNTHGLSTFVVD